MKKVQVVVGFSLLLVAGLLVIIALSGQFDVRASQDLGNNDEETELIISEEEQETTKTDPPSVESEIHVVSQHHEYAFDLPANWFGKAVVEETEESLSVSFHPESDKKQILFEIMVINELESYSDQIWKEITRENGNVYLYTFPSNNPYEGELKEQFQLMKADISEIIHSFALEPVNNPDDYLEVYFAALSMKDIETVVDHYGGDYEVLQGYNPNIDPNDKVGLMKAYVDFNGGQYVGLSSIISKTKVSDEEYSYQVTLNTLEGEPYHNGEVWTYTLKQIGEEYKVMELPPYQE